MLILEAGKKYRLHTGDVIICERVTVSGSADCSTTMLDGSKEAIAICRVSEVHRSMLQRFDLDDIFGNTCWPGRSQDDVVQKFTRKAKMKRCKNCGKHLEQHRPGFAGSTHRQCPMPGRRHAGTPLMDWYDSMFYEEKASRKPSHNKPKAGSVSRSK